MNPLKQDVQRNFTPTGAASWIAAASLIVGCLAIGGVATRADAQVAISMSRSIGGPTNTGMVSRRSVDRYTKALGFDDAQREAANLIHDGYASAFSERRRVMQEAMQAVSRAAEDTDDHTLFMQRVPGINKEFTDSTAKLEREFFADLRALIADGAQEERWPKVERMRRRETGLSFTQVSGEGVDLIALVDDMRLDSAIATQVGDALESYERELDRLLIAKAERQAQEPTFEIGKPIDLEAMQRAMTESRESGLRIRDLNFSSARRVETLLPDNERAKFASEFKKHCHPRIYRVPHVLRELDESLKMSDLDAQQREQIASLKESYSQRLASVNDAWAASIEASEKEGKSGGAVGGGGNRLVLNMQDDPEDLVRARTARRELDEQTAERLRAVLNAAQRDRLPNRDDEEARPVVMPRGGVTIRGGG
jgi:hypothetical protein